MHLTAIGYLRSCFRGKFGAPRQAGLVPSAQAVLELQPPYDDPQALRGLAGCSHIWLVFGFHLHAQRAWSPTVRPPRLGGNRRLGVFATRSPFRPNPLGLSVVALEGILDEPRRRGLRLSGQDLVDGTPVYDIKPYLPYSDALPGASVPRAFQGPPARVSVRVSHAAEAGFAAAPEALRRLALETLTLDPRPAYRHGEQGREHGMSLAGYNVRWRAEDGGLVVTEVSRESDTA